MRKEDTINKDREEQGKAITDQRERRKGTKRGPYMWHKMRRVFRYWTVMRQGWTPLCSGHLNNSKIGYSSMPHLGYVYLSCYLPQNRNRIPKPPTQNCSIGVAKVSKSVAAKVSKVWQ